MDDDESESEFEFDFEFEFVFFGEEMLLMDIGKEDELLFLGVDVGLEGV